MVIDDASIYCQYIAVWQTKLNMGGFLSVVCVHKPRKVMAGRLLEVSHVMNCWS